MADTVFIISKNRSDSLNFHDLLVEKGFEVLIIDNSIEAIELIRSTNPDMIIIDAESPETNAFDLCRDIKSDYGTSYIPIIILTSSKDMSYDLEGFDGADEYFVKGKIDYNEIIPKMKTILRRVRANIDANPLTGLPGNALIKQKIIKSVRGNESFSVAYCDIDNFKPFNDLYGFSKGDQVILMVARVLKKCIRRYGSTGDFLGHLGGDDFVMVGNPFTMRDVAGETVKIVSRNSKRFYDEKHKKVGGITGIDRNGIRRFFPLFGLTVAIVDIEPQSVTATPDQISFIASKIKGKLKRYGGNIFGGYEVLLAET